MVIYVKKREIDLCLVNINSIAKGSRTVGYRKLIIN